MLTFSKYFLTVIFFKLYLKLNMSILDLNKFEIEQIWNRTNFKLNNYEMEQFWNGTIMKWNNSEMEQF
jgi:hypothetical protein